MHQVHFLQNPTINLFICPLELNKKESTLKDQVKYSALIQVSSSPVLNKLQQNQLISQRFKLQFVLTVYYSWPTNDKRQHKLTLYDL